jgi:hypothetical protein
MTDYKMLSNSLWKKAWVAIRFILFGVFGFLVMFGAWVVLFDRLTSIRRGNVDMSAFLLLPLSLLGAVMMLFGVGEWGRWGYLLVFLSIPVSLSLLFVMPEAGGKEIGFIVPTVAAVSTYAVVRRYYARRKTGNADSA